jgi:glycosyltransferase involved in cell wall biosynthesis
MNIFFASRMRGFLKHLLTNKNLEANFRYPAASVYSTNSRFRNMLTQLVRNRIFDVLGIIQMIKPPPKYDMYGSYNRFLNTDKPYFIYVENPTALYHYCLGRNKTFLGKRKITGYLNNHDLRVLVFMSNICQNTFESVCGKISESTIKKTIYPLVPKNNYISLQLIKEKSYRNGIKLLFVAQGKRFASKGGLEVIDAFTKLRKGVELTIITNLDVIGLELCVKIKNLGITLFDFKLSHEQMQMVYADSDILLQPTSDDSSPLTILEAMKGGCTIIASRLYAIPEMVKEGKNGFLSDPAWWFFNPDGIPNPKVWNHRKKTIYSGKISDRIVSFLIDKIQLLNNDRELLEQMSINSYEKANSAPFDEDTIIRQWNEVFLEMRKIK